MDDDGREPCGHRQADDVGRIRHAHEHEAAVERGRDVVGMRRAGAEALALERAGDQRLERRIGAKQRVNGDDRRGGAGGAAAETAGERQPLADREGDAAPLAGRVSSARAATPAVLRSAARGRRPSSPMMSSIVTGGVARTSRGDRPSSPGASSANPSTSNPQATFGHGRAGANAVDMTRSPWQRIVPIAMSPFRASPSARQWLLRATSSLSRSARPGSVGMRIVAERALEVVRRRETPSRCARPSRRPPPATNRRCPDAWHRPCTPIVASGNAATTTSRISAADGLNAVRL